MGPAGWAIRILAQLELAEFHVERVDQQQPANQRLTLAQDQLDDFSGLHHTHESGQNAQHSTLGARWNQSWWRRFGIQAAVAGTFLGSEDTGLPFETEDRTVDVWFASQYAGIIHQVTRGK